LGIIFGLILIAICVISMMILLIENKDYICPRSYTVSGHKINEYVISQPSSTSSISSIVYEQETSEQSSCSNYTISVKDPVFSNI
jgi:hypothetical protein